MKRLMIAVLASGALFATAATPALAADPTLFGGAEKQGDVVALVSNTGDAVATNDFSGLDFAVPAGTTFSQLTTLATEYNVTDDDCKAGSPRFQINIGGKNVFVYLGPSPNFTGCAANTWTPTGNLIGNNDACRYDTSQLPGGKVCSTYAEALALLGSQVVTGIQLVVDSGWAFEDKEQTVLVRNVQINGTTYVTPPTATPAAKNAAKLCKAQRTQMGVAAFNAFYGTNANDRNAYGKCVSAMAKAQKDQRAGAVQTAIVKASKSCKAEGKRGAALGRCVKAKTAAVRAGKAQGKAKGKGKRP